VGWGSNSKFPVFCMGRIEICGREGSGKVRDKVVEEELVGHDMSIALQRSQKSEL